MSFYQIALNEDRTKMFARLNVFVESRPPANNNPVDRAEPLRPDSFKDECKCGCLSL